MNATLTTEREFGSAPTGTGSEAAPLWTVVGYDGSEPSRQALDAARRLMLGRQGHLEVVFVAHVSSAAAMSSQSEAGTWSVLNEIQGELKAEIVNVLGDPNPAWHFQRRDGAIAHELMAVAEDLRTEHGPEATIVIVVGHSVHRYHQLVGSIAVSLARQAKFPLMVVPSAHPVEDQTTAHPAGD